MSNIYIYSNYILLLWKRADNVEICTIWDCILYLSIWLKRRMMPKCMFNNILLSISSSNAIVDNRYSYSNDILGKMFICFTCLFVLVWLYLFVEMSRMYDRYVNVINTTWICDRLLSSLRGEGGRGGEGKVTVTTWMNEKGAK